MTTVMIEDSSVQAKHFIAYIRTLPFVKIKHEKLNSEYNLYESLDRAFADVRLMLDGKKKEKSLDEFLEEIQKEKENELCYKND